MKTELERQLAKLKQGDHVCLIYENTAEQLTAAVPFIREGLARNERCIFIADDTTIAEAVQALGAAGVNVEQARQKGALQMLRFRDVYHTPGEFDTQAMLDFIRQAEIDALAAGFTGLRFSGDPSWSVDPQNGWDAMVAYESMLNRLLENSRSLILCYYHHSRFEGPCIHDILRTHPLVIVGDQVSTNPHYRPPDQGSDIQPTASFAFLRTRVEWWIAHLKRGQATERESEQLIDRLLTLSDRLLEAQEAERRHRHSSERYREVAAGLQAANADLESFAVTLAHDLRAPLRSIQGFAQALLEDCGSRLEAPALDYVRRIENSGQELDRLIQDLLDYSRLSRADLATERVNLQAVVDKALAQLEATVQQRRASIIVEGPLPDVVGHWATLVQVVGNLLSNAIKFVAPGVQPRVRVWAEERTDSVRLWVADNGIGIAPENHERVFQVFERLHGAEAYPGSGIGLATVLKGMERIGGRSGVESALGNGSRFWIDLPRVSGSPA
ncbi:MAG TPA: MEDS domain-containing protein [Isosphaeraceae bacterium]|jgi:signal transduction histidine kinase|nr:MEDS domain-containing protein [Isosphaeraceae bacterium]